MQIKFLGAAGTVTGSSYVLTSGSGQSILIDLGMFQGPTEIDRLNYLPYDFDVKSLVGAVLTHAHLDHCGRLPILLPLGFTGDIWMTPPTRELTELSLLDSAKIATEDHKNVLYDAELANKTFTHFKTIEYHQEFSIGDFKIIMHDAGHILGSASLEIHDGQQKIVFSGDIGNYPEDLLQPTEFMDSADFVVMESTYGDRLHPKSDPAEALATEIQAIQANPGTLLIPAFSLERTQELLHLIGHLKSSGKILAETPVYLDSPMAEKATVIYEKYPKVFNPHIQEDLKSGNPFEFPGFQVIPGRRASDNMDDQIGAKVIIAGSGMMTGGRIVGLAAHYLPMPTTRLLIVGFQAEKTLGRRLLEGTKQVDIDGRTIEVRATINNTDAMSSHADQGQLLDWLKHINGVKKLFLTHGENPSRKTLSEKVTQDLKISDITLPSLGQEVKI